MNGGDDKQGRGGPPRGKRTGGDTRRDRRPGGPTARRGDGGRHNPRRGEGDRPRGEAERRPGKPRGRPSERSTRPRHRPQNEDTAPQKPRRQLPFELDALRGAARVELLTLDVDGVLTDGLLYYSSNGVETKAFHAQDGAAIKMLQGAGVPVALISGRESEAVTRRAAELGIAHVYQGADDKGVALNDLCAAADVAPTRMAHMGDDVGDLPLFDRVGFRIAVPGAHPEVAARAHHVTKARPGAGAVREACQLILVAKGRWESALAALSER